MTNPDPTPNPSTDVPGTTPLAPSSTAVETSPGIFIAQN